MYVGSVATTASRAMLAFQLLAAFSMAMPPQLARLDDPLVAAGLQQERSEVSSLLAAALNDAVPAPKSELAHKQEHVQNESK